MTDAAPKYLTVHELADLLRIKERKVYDLAASGSLPCSRATGKLLFPREDIFAWIERAQSGGTAQTHKRPDILLGSHDPLLDWAVRQSQSGIATFYDGSQDGLDRFCLGEGTVAGMHMFDAASQSWNQPRVSELAQSQDAVLMRFATRRRGLVLGSGVDGISQLGDLVGRRLVPRQAGSGTESVFAHLATEAGLDLAQVDMQDVARTEDDAVERVRLGEGDATFGLEAVAAVYGLAFVPLIDEHFDLLVNRRSWFEAPLQALWTFLQTDKFKLRAEQSAGYETSQLGEVIWNS